MSIHNAMRYGIYPVTHRGFGGKFKMAAVSEGTCCEWLKKNYNLNVKREWLEACIEFLKQEHGVSLLYSRAFLYSME